MVSADVEIEINEAGLEGYEFVSVSGDGCPVSLPGNVGPLSDGDVITCTITNTLSDVPLPAPTVTLTKALQDGDADLDSFGLTIGGTPVTSGETLVVSADVEIEINEAGLEGYEFVSVSGDGCPVSLPGNVGPLSDGDVITCTITNTLSDVPLPAPTVTLTKALQDGDADLDSFGLTIGGTPVTSGETLVVSADVEIEINEAGLEGYEFVSVSGDGCPVSFAR